MLPAEDKLLVLLLSTAIEDQASKQPIMLLRLIGLLQLASANPSSLVGTLGHSNQAVWFQDNIDAIFQSYGPMGMYNPISPLVLLRHFALASNQAKEVYD